MRFDLPDAIAPLPRLALQPQASEIAQLTQAVRGAKRPLLWLGGGARHCHSAVMRFVKMGWGVVTSVQGRGVIPEHHPACIGAFNLQPATEQLYAQCDAMIVVGSRLRSNETLGFKLRLPKNLFRIDANALVENRGYPSAGFVCGDAALTLDALANQLEATTSTDAAWPDAIARARVGASEHVDHGLGPYIALKNTLNHLLQGNCTWVRDITLSNTMWGNRSLMISDPRAGVHALGGGIGQGVGASIASARLPHPRKTVALVGDGGFMLNVGELACAVQENVNLVVLLMNDGGYGVIKNIQDAIYGGRHCYVELHTPNFAQLCESMGAKHLYARDPASTEALLAQALNNSGVTIVEVDMNAWGPFAVKFAGPPKRKDGE
jgi:acetolactate synthase I/II/III large subunit